jgi:hypothetical protein
MNWNERHHKETFERFQRKFLDDKQRLEDESNKKIRDIATHAQDEALKYVYIYLCIAASCRDLMCLCNKGTRRANEKSLQEEC